MTTPPPPSGTRDSEQALPLGCPSAPERRRARLVLLLIAVAYVAFHVLVVGLDRAIFWDEATHFTQVARGRSTVFLEPHRTRGVSMLVAPIGVFDPSMTVLRAYLAVLGGVGIFAAFATWIRSIGYAAPLAALVFSAYRVTVHYGVEVLPNLPSALLCVAAAGLTVRAADNDDVEPGVLVGLAGVMCLFALVRPPDAVLTGISLAVVLAAMRWRAARRAVPVAAAGGTIGILAWFIEGALRFGFDPVTLVRSGGDYSANATPINRLPLYLRFLDGRMRCSPACERELLADGSLWAAPRLSAAVFLAASSALALLAVRYGGARRHALLVPATVGALILGFYASTSIMHHRYVLPTVAVWLLAPAVGGVVVWRWAGIRGGAVGTTIRVVAATLLVVVIWTQATTGARQLQANMSGREQARALGEVLRDAASGEPCAVATTTARPMIEYWSGCPAVTLVQRDDGAIQAPLGELESYVDLSALHERGHRVFAISRRPVRDDSPVASWRATPLDGDLSGYILYEHTRGGPLPPPPCPPDGGAVRILGDVMSEGC